MKRSDATLHEADRESLSDGALFSYAAGPSGAGSATPSIAPSYPTFATLEPQQPIAGAPPASVRLLWPTNDPDFSLEFGTNLTTTNWAPAPPPTPVSIGTNNVVTNAATDAERFYRLFKP